MSFPGLGDLPTMDSAQQALAWQQSQYLTDSGIHSGMSTRRASVSSRQGVLESVEESPENGANRQAHLSAKFQQPVYGSQSADGKITMLVNDGTYVMYSEPWLIV